MCVDLCMMRLIQHLPSDVSVERQDSTTDYAADNSSAEQSSSGTPLTMSPRRGPHLVAGRLNSNGNEKQVMVIVMKGENDHRVLNESGTCKSLVAMSLKAA